MGERASFGVCGADSRVTARSVFSNPRRRAPDWTKQGVRLKKPRKLTFILDQRLEQTARLFGNAAHSADE